MAPPSRLPSAARVSEACFEKYVTTIDPKFDPALKYDLEKLAQHFADQRTLQTIFIDSLVPWGEFVRQPNKGHVAIADFLITRAAAATLSSNYDALIERWAIDNGFDFQISLDGDEANVNGRTQSPLLKFHGCATKDRRSTVWAPSQLNDPLISGRIAKTKQWMAANLREKDLLIVGFWSDWEYLNGVLETVLEDVAPSSVTVIDLAEAADLAEKAPGLWALAHRENVVFRHVQQSAADALDELRKAFSENYLRAILYAGRDTFEEVTGISCQSAWLEIPDFDSDTLYALRRDAEGVPAGRPALNPQPRSCQMLGMFHLLLRHGGATATEFGYKLDNQEIRVLNGSGSMLSQMKTQFVEPPAVADNRVVVAVGALDIGLPGNAIREGRAGDIMRPAASEAWYDFEGARKALGI